MKATAWSNGAGYGLRISASDRDRVFDTSWSAVLLKLPDGSVASVGLSQSFWRRCSEVRSAELGQWMLVIRLAPWPRDSHPFSSSPAVRRNVSRSGANEDVVSGPCNA